MRREQVLKKLLAANRVQILRQTKLLALGKSNGFRTPAACSVASAGRGRARRATCRGTSRTNLGHTDAPTRRDDASMRDPSSGARSYATSQSARCTSSKSVGDRARAGKGGVDGGPIDTRIAPIGSASVSIAMNRSLPPHRGHCKESMS
jgi:hypothetical protein